MNQILDKIKNKKLAAVLGISFLADVLIGLILLLGLKKVDGWFLLITFSLDLVFALGVYFVEFFKRTERHDVLRKGFLVTKNLLFIFYYMEYFCGDIKNVIPMDVRFWLNALIYITLMILIFTICYRLPATIITFNVFTFVLLIVNLFLVDERGLPFFLVDLFAMGTAMDVAGAYSFNQWPEYVCIFVWFLTSTVATIFVLKMQTKTKPEKKRYNALIRLCGLGFVFGVLTLFLQTSFMNDCGIEPYFWKHTKNGVALNLMMDAKYSKIQKPKEYDVEKLSEIASQYKGTENDSKVKPNVLVVMSESFADLTTIGEFETNVEITPFIDSLKEDTIRGYLYSSVYGGNTANSEYEFLTADTMLCYPHGAVAYQTYLKGKTFLSSLVRNIGVDGYKTISFHPNKASNWNRAKVYPALGFDREIWIDDVKDPENLRNHLSDETDYKKVMEEFENKDTEEPYFFFNITMQNHGGYLIKDFENEVIINGEEGKYPKAEQYLTCVRVTDEQTKELIEYFKNYKEPTIILFYGDHQPKIDSKLIEDMLGGSMDNLEVEQLQKLYMTPFFIWANYDIPEEEGVKMSINYLSSYLADVAGLSKTGYQQYLSELYKKYPVINANGAIDAEGNYYTSEEAEEIPEINIYRCFTYNHMYDSKGYIKDFFEK